MKFDLRIFIGGVIWATAITVVTNPRAPEWAFFSVWGVTMFAVLWFALGIDVLELRRRRRR